MCHCQSLSCRQPRDRSFQVADDVDTASFAPRVQLQEVYGPCGCACTERRLPPVLPLQVSSRGSSIAGGKNTPYAASHHGGAPLLSPVQCAVREELDSVGETPSGLSKLTYTISKEGLLLTSLLPGQLATMFDHADRCRDLPGLRSSVPIQA